MLAGLDRPTAALLALIFIVDGVRQLRSRGSIRWTVLYAAAPLVAVASYVAAVGYVLGDPLAYLKVEQTFWGHAWAIPFQPLFMTMQDVVAQIGAGALPLPEQLMRIVSALTVLSLLVWGWRRIDLSLWVYLAVSFVFLHSQRVSYSSARYELVLFPVFILLGRPPCAQQVGRRGRWRVAGNTGDAPRLLWHGNWVA